MLVAVQICDLRPAVHSRIKFEAERSGGLDDDCGGGRSERDGGGGRQRGTFSIFAKTNSTLPRHILICFSSVLHLSCLFASSCLLSRSQLNSSWFTGPISYIHFNIQYIPDRNFISLFNSYNLEFTLRRDSPKKRNTSSTTTSFACSRIQCPTSSMRTSFIPLTNS